MQQNSVKWEESEENTLNQNKIWVLNYVKGCHSDIFDACTDDMEEDDISSDTAVDDFLDILKWYTGNS